MPKNKKYELITFLKSFSKIQLNQLARFVHSPYFNTDQKVCDLFDSIYSKFDRINTNKPQHFEKLLALKKYQLDKQTILKNLAILFLQVEILKNKQIHASKIELRNTALLKNKAFYLNKKMISKKENQIEQEFSHQYNFTIESNKLEHFTQAGLLTKEDNFSNYNIAMDKWYLSNKMHTHLLSMSVSKVNNKKYNYDIFKIDKHKEKIYKRDPLIKTLRAARYLVLEPNDERCNHLFKTLKKNIHKIPNHQAKDLYMIAINYYTSKIRQGPFQYYRKVFDLYDNLDKNNMLLDGDIMPILTLKTVIAASCHCGELDWANEILHKYKNNIPKYYRKNVFLFNEAVILFYKKQYKEAESKLQDVWKKPFNPTYDLNCRTLLLKASYETDLNVKEAKYAISNFDSALNFIKKNKDMNNENRIAFYNYINTLKKLFKIKNGLLEKNELSKVEQEVNAFKLIQDKQYLLDKIEGLKLE